MGLSVKQMTTLITADEAEAKVLQICTSFGLPVTSWQEGGAYRTLIAAGAELFATIIAPVVQALAKAFSLDTAEGDWLTIIAWERYGVRRADDTPGTTTLTINNAKGGLYTFAVGELLIKSSANGKLYKNSAPVTILPLATGVSVDIIALEAGTASNAAAGEIDTFVTAYPGLTCTNASALLGADGETDPELRQLCRDSLGRLSPMGPEAAYVYQAKRTFRADGTLISVNRVKVSKSGVPVYVTVASSSGTVDGDPLDTATDLGLIQKAIEDNVCPFGVTTSVSSATELPLDVVATIYVSRTANVLSAELVSDAQDSLAAYLASVPIGGHVISPSPTGYVYVNALVGVLERLNDYVIKADVDGGNVPVGAYEVTTTGTLTISVVQV